MGRGNHPKSGTKTSIWWVRRDLRLHDNRALRAALERSGEVVPLFVIDPEVMPGFDSDNLRKQDCFLLGALRSLGADLHAKGSRLIIRRGNPHEVLAAVMAETGADAVFAEEEYGPYERRRDADIAANCPLSLIPGMSLHHPKSLLKDNGRPYIIFTPFSRKWKKLRWPAREEMFGAPAVVRTPIKLFSESIPEPAELAGFPTSEREARRRLKAFIGGSIARYKYVRDRLDLAGTSELSPYFRFGMLSVREAIIAAVTATMSASDPEARQGMDLWINELVWREFYISVLYNFPDVLHREFNPAFRGIRWHNDAAGLRSWQEGRTGYPVVDAAMRQLSSTGWMHNRARMIVASFLVKDLGIDWREGEQWFVRHLVDADPAANNGGWQWTAGVGTDAAPYFRIFNPVLQSKKFDPGGHFIRKWVPELVKVHGRFTHEPWRMSDSAQVGCGCVIGRHYPAPIVDHASAREHALAAYRHLG